MKKISVLLGIGVLSLMLVSFVDKNKCEKLKEHETTQQTLTELQKDFTSEILSTQHTEPLSIDEITFIEIEEEIDLGYDTTAYLPIGFNAYEGMEFNIDDFKVIELDEEIELGFDTSAYLPEGFNPYEGMELELEDIFAKMDLNDLIEIFEEEEIDLGFDTAKYLPKGFDANTK